MDLAVELVRGGLVESRHGLHVAVVKGDGALVAWSGDPHHRTYMRSAAKPLQALPLLSEGVAAAAGITPAELAVCCGSHGGEPGHLRRVRSLLSRFDLGEAALECGPHLPMHEASAHGLLRSGGEAAAIHNNCSGKHAGMLALARGMGWPTEGYSRPGHPVQERILAEVERWTGVPGGQIRQGVDGCGVPCFGLPIYRMARAFAALVGSGGPGETALLDAMAAHPFEVAGTGRLCTELMQVAGGRIVAKVGAEGVYCALDRAAKLGIAVKVEDGGRRAAEPALLAVLREMGCLKEDEEEQLKDRLEPSVPNTLDRPAAKLRVRGGLSREPGEGGPVLPPPLRALVRVSGALATGSPKRIRAALSAAVDVADPGSVEEVLLQSHLFLGFPGALNGLALWRRVSGRPPPPPRPDDPASRAERGAMLCSRVYGEQYAALRRNISGLHPDMDRWMVEEGYGKTLGRSGISLRDRELCIVALLAVLGVPVQLYSHLRGALEVGASESVVAGTLDAVGDLMGPDDRTRAHRVWGSLRSRRRRSAGLNRDELGRGT